MSLMKKLNLNLGSFLVFFLNCSFSYSEDVKNIYGKPDWIFSIDKTSYTLTTKKSTFIIIHYPNHNEY